MITMAMEHFGQTQDFEDTLMYINQVFIAIFTLECIMKILGLRWYYFKQAWNIFDFIVVVLSVLGTYNAFLLRLPITTLAFACINLDYDPELTQ